MEQNIRNVFEWSPVGLLLFHTDDPFLPAESAEWACEAANGAACNLLGRLPLEKLSLEEVFPPVVASNLRNGALVHPLSNAVDFFVSDPGRWLLAAGNRHEHQLMVSLTDITRQKESAFADHKLMRLYQSLSGSLQDHEIILFDRDFNIVLTEGQPRFIRLNLEGELKGRRLTQLFEENEFSFLGEYVTSVFGSKTRNEIEREINGRLFKACLYSDDRDDETQMIGVLLVKDVTELAQKQRELTVRMEQLQRSNKELETFAYVASHDLQEPLRKIKSFGERLQYKYAPLLQTEGQNYINRMNEAANRMERLIDDLLLYSRATRQDDSFELIDLGQCIANAIANLEIVVEAKQASIEQPATWPSIEAIPTQMEQLFQNIIGNSLRFAQKDMKPVIKIQHSVALGNELTQWKLLMPDKGYCVIRIEDNGIGFDQENAERIFTIFQRLNGRLEYEGAGIGLAICKKIVENHDGLITAEGRIGLGAVFTIVLPMEQE